MADIVRVALHTGRAWWLQSLNGLLLVSAVALVTLVIGEAYYALEDRHEPGAAHDHGFFGPIFDVAWFVFVPTFVASVLAGIVAVIAGRFLHRRALSRYGSRAIAFCSLAVAVVAAVAILQS